MAGTPTCTIDATGVHKPEFADVLAYYQAGYRAIYGDDTYLGNDSPDGQLLALLATGLDDVNAECVAAVAAYSPAGAQGTGLSSIVKLNNLRRKVPSYSTWPVVVVGQAGVTITNGTFSDGTNTWALPASVTIPFTGQVAVTATAAALGSINLPATALDTADDVGSISSGTPGWQAVYATAATSPGQPVEQDSQLRQRQAVSTAIPAQTTAGALLAGLLAIDGVTYANVYGNSTTQPDANGVPGQCISCVVQGGDDGLVAQMIALKKGICGTYGNTAVVVTDSNGVARTIRYYRPVQVPITANLTVKPLAGFTLATQAQLAVALATGISNNGIGAQLYYLQQLYALAGVGTGYAVEGIALARDGLLPAAQDVPLAYYEAPYCVPGYVGFPGLPPLPGSA